MVGLDGRKGFLQPKGFSSSQAAQCLRMASTGCGPEPLSVDAVLLFILLLLGEGGARNLDLTHFMVFLVGKGLSSHPWDAVSKLGASGLSSAWVLWPDGSSGMLSAARRRCFWEQAGTHSLVSESGKEREMVLVLVAAQEGSAQPKDWEGSSWGVPGPGGGKGPRSAECSSSLRASLYQPQQCKTQGSGLGDRTGTC